MQEYFYRSTGVRTRPSASTLHTCTRTSADLGTMESTIARGRPAVGSFSKHSLSFYSVSKLSKSKSSSLTVFHAKTILPSLSMGYELITFFLIYIHVVYTTSLVIPSYWFYHHLLHSIGSSFYSIQLVRIFYSIQLVQFMLRMRFIVRCDVDSCS